MRDHRPTNTQDLIQQSRFSQLQQHSQQILQINQMLSALLPRGTETHCRVANIRNGQLILDVASGAIKIKLEYDRLSILNKLRCSGFANLTSIEIRINPALYHASPEQADTKANQARISQAASESLLTIAQTAPPKIKQRLQKIAALANRDKQK